MQLSGFKDIHRVAQPSCYLRRKHFHHCQRSTPAVTPHFPRNPSSSPKQPLTYFRTLLNFIYFICPWPFNCFPYLWRQPWAWGCPGSILQQQNSLMLRRPLEPASCRPLCPLCSSHHVWAAQLFDGDRLKGLSDCEVLALMWQPGRSSRMEGSSVACHFWGLWTITQISLWVSGFSCVKSNKPYLSKFSELMEGETLVFNKC